MAERRETSRGRKTREKILRVATGLMSQHGYSGTSVDMICTEAKVVKTAIYWHFGNKSGLMAAVIDDISDSWVGVIEAQVGGAATPAERLDSLLASLKDLVTNRSTLLRLIEVVIIEAAHLDDEITEAVGRLHRRTIDAIVKGFNASLGFELTSGPMLAHTIMSLMHGIHRYLLLYGDKVDVDAYFDDMRRTILCSVQEGLKRT